MLSPSLPASPSRTPGCMHGSKRSPSTRTGTAWPGICTTRSSSGSSPSACPSRAWPAGPRHRASRIGLKRTIADIDDTIRQVRATIFELGSDGLDRGVRDNVLSLLEELRPVVGFDVGASFDGPGRHGHLRRQSAEHLLAVIREAVTNIGRHAQATRATVAISVRMANAD